MSRFVSRKSVKIEADDESGDWVEIKPRMSRGDKDAIAGALYQTRHDGDELVVSGNVMRRETLLLVHNVVGWNLTDEQDNTLQINAENIERLDPDDPLIDKVLGEIAERNPTRGPVENETTGSKD